LRRLRDVFYINAFPESNEVIYYGMQLNEFIKYAPVELNQLLLLSAEYYGTGFQSKTKFEIVEKDEMSEFLKEDIYGYGDFCWVDFNHRENVENLEPFEIAELLYLGHMFQPINKPFFDKIQNRYAYLAHDDGWFCRLYCRQYSDFQEVITNKILGMVSTNKRKKIYPFSIGVKEKLMSMAEDGLLIDFSNILKFNNTIEIPIYCIGKFLDMDDMYNDLYRHINRSKYYAKLVHKNKKWEIDFVVEK
jgi:hypothetical protein